jgi:hypothetical protein
MSGAGDVILNPLTLAGGRATRWSWSTSLKASNSNGLLQRLAAWNPSAPEGRQLLFSVRRPDGTEVLLYENQLGEAWTAAPTDENGNLPAFEGTSGLADYTTHVGKGVMYHYEAPKIAVQQPAATVAVAAAPAARKGMSAEERRASHRAAARAVSGRAGSGGATVYASASRGATTATGAAAVAAAQAVAPVNAIAFNGPAVPAGAGVSARVPNATGVSQPATMEDMRESMRERMMKRTGAVKVSDVAGGGPNGRRMMELTFADGSTQQIPYDPLVFDLKGRGAQTDDRRVLFDLYGKGGEDKQQWMNDFDAGTGVLVFDADGGGKSGTSGAEVFGDRTDLSGVGRPDGFENGFAALRGLAEKAVTEGVLSRETVDGGVLNAEALAALEKAYGLRMKVGGLNKKAISLAQAGVASISLASAPTRFVHDYDSRGNGLMLQAGAVFTRADGSTGAYMNVWLSAKTGNLGLAKR